MESKCIGEMEHKLEYLKTEEGKSYYKCSICNDVEWVAEDTGSGG